MANQGTSTQLTLELKQENRTVLVKTGRKITFLVNTSIFLIFITTDEWGWSSLPRSYLNGPYLCRDGVSLNKTTTSTCAAPIESQEECVVHDNLQDEIPLKVRVLTT